LRFHNFCLISIRILKRLLHPSLLLLLMLISHLEDGPYIKLFQNMLKIRVTFIKRNFFILRKGILREFTDFPLEIVTESSLALCLFSS